MKKRILSLILIMFLLPGAIILSACSKGGGYNLANLSEDFYSIATEEEDDSIIEQYNTLSFDYSLNMLEAMANSSIYYKLNYYNNVYQNIMSFSFNYVNICSNNEIKIDKDIKNSLENRLKEFHSALRRVDNCVKSFDSILKTTQTNISQDEFCLSRFQNLLNAYESLFEKASMFNAELSNIYFNYLVTNSNPNINEYTEATFDVGLVISKLNARKCWQISNLSTAYAEMYLIGSSVSTEIVAGGSLELNPTDFNYSDMVEAINKDINESAAIQVAQNNQLAFYQASKRAYAAQTILNNDYSKYYTACSNIKYAKEIVDNNINNANIKIINDYSSVLIQYNDILVNMLDIIEV